MNTFFDLSRLLAQQHDSNQRYLEFLRVPALSAGVYVLPAGDKFSVAATNSLAETCMASPAVCDGTLFYRTREQVVAIGKK